MSATDATCGGRRNTRTSKSAVGRVTDAVPSNRVSETGVTTAAKVTLRVTPWIVRSPVSDSSYDVPNST